MLALVSGSLVARLLGPAGRGELAAIQTWSAFLALLASLGLPDAVVYFSGREPNRSATFLVSAMTLMILVGVPVALISYLTMPLLLSAQSTETIAIAGYYVVAFILLMATSGMLIQPLRGRNDFLSWNALRLLASVLWVLAVLATWLLGTVTSRTVALAYLASLVVFGVIAAFVLANRVPGPYFMKTTAWRPMLRFGLPSALSSLPQTLNLRLDQMLMAAFLPATSLGYYAIAVTWSAASAPLLQGVGGVLFPRVAITRTRSEQIELLGRGGRVGVLVGGALTAILLAATPIAITLLFGRAYAPAIPIAFILVVAGLESALAVILEEGLRGLGQTKAVLAGETVGLAATTVSLAFMLAPLQVIGAALASLIGYGFTLGALVYILCRSTERRPAFFLLPSPADWRLLRNRLRALWKGNPA